MERPARRIGVPVRVAGARQIRENRTETSTGTTSFPHRIEVVAVLVVVLVNAVSQAVGAPTRVRLPEAPLKVAKRFL